MLSQNASNFTVPRGLLKKEIVEQKVNCVQAIILCKHKTNRCTKIFKLLFWEQSNGWITDIWIDKTHTTVLW